MEAITLHPEWKELYEQARQWDYGTMKTHEEIAAILKLRAGTTQYYQAVSRAAKELLDVQKCLESVRKMGYRIAEPREHIDVSKRYFKHGIKRIRRSVRVAMSTDESRLTADERKQLDAWNERLAKTTGVLSYSQKKLREIAAGSLLK